ncbi:hypothetical protein HETIRDRAFT_406553 [Heterobasidion irregulare TC 32-1]|uniref:Uncharacterized protein n=1 Tax=Heterobasidion irregulare (strain TC 32-1) TaxID=747525 RepID=W4KLG1_HETIT|nr:uncharacterized protein HETIRDRAFT_406553 [Heterobasidion irregulare TC 32-1]ETW86539.1 hypothetical protein HETIRDRAFT_406553 [Heterobasidion irregulare TC 32-1]
MPHWTSTGCYGIWAASRVYERSDDECNGRQDVRTRGSDGVKRGRVLDIASMVQPPFKG